MSDSLRCGAPSPKITLSSVPCIITRSMDNWTALWGISMTLDVSVAEFAVCDSSARCLVPGAWCRAPAPGTRRCPQCLECIWWWLSYSPLHVCHSHKYERMSPLASFHNLVHSSILMHSLTQTIYLTLYNICT